MYDKIYDTKCDIYISFKRLLYIFMHTYSTIYIYVIDQFDLHISSKHLKFNTCYRWQHCRHQLISPPQHVVSSHPPPRTHILSTLKRLTYRSVAIKFISNAHLASFSVGTVLGVAYPSCMRSPLRLIYVIGL